MHVPDIVDYARAAGSAPLRIADMNDADALLLAVLSWYDWRGTAEGIPLRDAVELYERSGDMARLDARHAQLLRVMAASPRYAGLMLHDFERRDSVSPALQFAALTVTDGADAYIAYRGTDSSLAGWFEDLQLAYDSPTPAQELAAEYLQRAAPRFGGGLHLGGHSKGGALAVYAAVHAGEHQPRVLRVWSFDGPGVARAEYLSPEYGAVRDRLLTVVPPQSLVGMLLWQGGEQRVVRSALSGAGQHDPFSWQTDAEGLDYGAELSSGSRRVREVMRRLLTALPQPGIRRLTDALYDMVQATGARTVDELNAYFARSAGALLHGSSGAEGRALAALLQLIAAAVSAEPYGDAEQPAAAALPGRAARGEA